MLVENYNKFLALLPRTNLWNLVAWSRLWVDWAIFVSFCTFDFYFS